MHNCTCTAMRCQRGDNRAEQLCPRRHICYCEPSALLYAKGPFSNLLPWNHSTCLLVTTSPGSSFHSIYSQERQQLEKKKWGLRIKGPFIWRFIFVNILLLCFSNWWIGQNVYMRLEFSHMHHFNILQNEDYAACISFLIWWAVMLNKSTFFFK